MTMSIKKQLSRCMFCNSTMYGSGCPYSPHKKHVHVSDGRKCIYCGSIATGTGCPYNPFSRIHVKGVEFNTMAKESIHNSIMTSLFLSRFIQPVIETSAYRLGLIDEHGNKLKECVTDEERAALTPLDVYIFKIRRLIGESYLDLFKSEALLETTLKTTEQKFDIEKYKKEIEIKSKIDNVICTMEEIFAEGIQCGLSKNHVENLLIENILKKYNDQEN